MKINTVFVNIGVYNELVYPRLSIEHLMNKILQLNYLPNKHFKKCCYFRFRHLDTKVRLKPGQGKGINNGRSPSPDNENNKSPKRSPEKTSSPTPKSQ